MKIVVLAGGTSTERDVSIVSGTGICGALRQKGHQAILVDVFCGQEEVDWEDPFPAEYDVEKAAAYIRGFNLQMAELKKTRKNFFGPNVIDLCKKADFVFLKLSFAVCFLKNPSGNIYSMTGLFFIYTHFSQKL